MKAQGDDAHNWWETNVLAGNNTLAEFEKNIAANAGVPSKGIIGATPGAPATDPAQQGALTSLLQRLGVDYPNAPAATPALLAFLRGIGMNLDTAGDVRNKAVARIQQSATDNSTEVNRQSELTKKNVTGDLVRRGVLQSGEANTRYANQAADTGKKLSDIASSEAAGISSADTSLQGVTDAARQTALEKVLQTEQDQATAKATSDAQTQSHAQQQAASDKAAADQKAAQDDYLAQLKQLYQQYAGQGVVV